MVRRAIAAYFGLVSSIDDNVGNVLRALRRHRARSTTRA